MLNSMPVPEEFTGVDAALLYAALLLVIDGRLPLEHVPDFIARSCHLLGYNIETDTKELARKIFYLVASP